MIIVETKLKKIPDNCVKCKFSHTFYDARICDITDKIIEMQKVESGNKAYVRPVWCQLKEI